jgi:peptidoglycan biosynthesis protein MviN/MurJ (putative lipid II flippase)
MPAVREFLRLMVPRMAGAPIEPLTFQFFTRLASTFAAGSVSAVSFARNFQSVPVSLIGVAFSIAAFPALSVAAGQGDRVEFVRVLRTNVVTVAALTIAAGLGLFILSRFAIDLFLGGGAFDQGDVDRTSGLLSLFALSVPIESLTYPLARAIYATRNTILPVSASLVGLVATIVTASAVAPSLGLSAVPIAFVVGSVAKLAILAAVLPARIRQIPALATVELSDSP